MNASVHNMILEKDPLGTKTEFVAKPHELEEIYRAGFRDGMALAETLHGPFED